MKIAKSLIGLIGHTPLLQLTAFSKAMGLSTPLIGKLESMNPGGSAKDRAALSMIRDAEASGRLQPGGTIIEPTSGNMGVGLAWEAAVLGYRMIVVMPDTMSEERRTLVRAYGADLHLSPGNEGMKGAIDLANRLLAEIKGSVILGQFDNEANPAAHEQTTAQEIWDDTDGTVDAFIAGIGTGGTVSGVGKKLKALKPSVHIVGVEPAASPVLTEGTAGEHKLQGLGANFIPHTYHPEYIDDVATAGDDESIAAARLLAKTEGLLCGISTGAALVAAVRLAKQDAWKNKNIVVLLPDTGERYLSTYEFDFENYPLPE